MPDLIALHGGVAEPVNLTVYDVTAPFSAPILVSDADLAVLCRIADGALSPLTGPMGKAEFDRVLEEEVIVRGGKKYAWTIPLALPVGEDVAKKLTTGSAHPMLSSGGGYVGMIEVEDVYPWDKKKYNAAVYQTTREDHPGARLANSDARTYLVGGHVKVQQPKNKEFGDLLLSPKETRALFARKGFQRVVAFQTRTVLTRAHEYALVAALERLTREGHHAGAVLNPLVGEAKGDDVDAATRVKTYRALTDTKALGRGDTDEELWKTVGRAFSDQVMLLGLDFKTSHAGPKEAVIHAIIRQNYGFTDIVIGRKHADSHYDDGTAIWEPQAAQQKFDELKGELLIKPVKVGPAAYYAELGRVGLVEEHAPKGWKPVKPGGSDLRAKLAAGELPDPGVMRPETAKVLMAKYQGR